MGSHGDAVRPLIAARLRPVTAYRNEDRKPNSKGETGPKNERLVASIDTARLAVARSLYTDALEWFPEPAKEVWWEVWLRAGTRAAFDVAVLTSANAPVMVS